MVAQQVRQKANLTISWLGQQPFGYLFLEHDRQVLEPVFQIDQPAQNGRPFAVGQVGNHLPLRCRIPCATLASSHRSGIQPHTAWGR
jgi:hypothetical protein